MGLIQKIFGSKNQRELNKLQPNVNRINQLGDSYKAKSDAELRAVTGELKQKLDNGASLDDILCDAFAAVREASITVLKHENPEAPDEPPPAPKNTLDPA